MALVLPMHENLSEDKHVESLLLPRLDAGSTPAGSTKKDASVVSKHPFSILKGLVFQRSNMM